MAKPLIRMAKLGLVETSLDVEEEARCGPGRWIARVPTERGAFTNKKKEGEREEKKVRSGRLGAAHHHHQFFV